MMRKSMHCVPNKTSSLRLPRATDNFIGDKSVDVRNIMWVFLSVPALFLNSRLAVKWPWILECSESPWIVFENEKTALASLEFSSWDNQTSNGSRLKVYRIFWKTFQRILVLLIEKLNTFILPLFYGLCTKDLELLKYKGPEKRWIVSDNRCRNPDSNISSSRCVALWRLWISAKWCCVYLVIFCGISVSCVFQ